MSNCARIFRTVAFAAGLGLISAGQAVAEPDEDPFAPFMYAPSAPSGIRPVVTPSRSFFTPPPIEERAISAVTAPEPPHLVMLQSLPGADEYLTREVRIQKGDTLISAITRSGVDYGEAFSVSKKLSSKIDVRRLQIGDKITLLFDPAPKPGAEGELKHSLIGCEIEGSRLASQNGRWLDDDADLTALNSPFASPAHEIVHQLDSPTKPRKPGHVLVASTIRKSLFVDGREAGLTPRQLVNVTKILQHRVDFQRGLRQGDKLEVLFERVKNEEGEIVDGDIHYVSLENRGRTITAYLGPDGAYLDENAKNNRRLLMRTPIQGARITSGFGKRRHPILGYSKMHKGVDFSARSGTKILAAGDGVVEKLGWVRGFGRYVRIRHNGTYKTAYAHLRGYKKGLKQGSRVKQGQLIGYVGASGLATSAHLHFEVLKNGVQVNPRKIKDFGALSGAAGDGLKKFKAKKKKIDNIVASLREATVAQAD